MTELEQIEALLTQFRRLSRDGSQFLQVDKKDVQSMNIDEYLKL
jgi:hypothetical protein